MQKFQWQFKFAWFFRKSPYATSGMHGEVSEWSIVHPWKGCVPNGTGGSNPPLSAMIYYFLFIDTCFNSYKKLLISLVIQIFALFVSCLLLFLLLLYTLDGILLVQNGDFQMKLNMASIFFQSLVLYEEYLIQDFFRNAFGNG